MRTVVFASNNAGKIKELQALLGKGFRVKSAPDFPEIPEVDEDADTFEGNSAKKAPTFAKATGLWALADDSGLVVDALDGGKLVEVQGTAENGSFDRAQLNAMLDAGLAATEKLVELQKKVLG